MSCKYYFLLMQYLLICYMIHRSSYLKFGGPDPAWPRAPKSGGSADPADPVLPTPLYLIQEEFKELGGFYLPNSAWKLEANASTVPLLSVLTPLPYTLSHYAHKYDIHAVASPAPTRWGANHVSLQVSSKSYNIHTWGTPSCMWKKLFNGFALIPRGVWTEVRGVGTPIPPWRRHCIHDRLVSCYSTFL